MTIKKHHFLFLLVVIYMGCSNKVVTSTVSNSCKARIYDFLKEQWFCDEKTRTYRVGNQFHELTISNFAKDGCLQELSRDEVITLFGVPINEIGNELHYYYHQECFDHHETCRSSLVIKVNKDGNFESL